MSGKRKTRETSEQQGSRRSKAESRVRSIGKQLKQKHMNILLIHGLNTPENPSPYGGWITAIEAGLKNSNFVGPGESDPDELQPNLHR
jgi:hypothetical protein